MSFPRRELSAALEYVRQRSLIAGSDDEAERPTIYTTGFACTQHGRLISDALSVKYVYGLIIYNATERRAVSQRQLTFL